MRCGAEEGDLGCGSVGYDGIERSGGFEFAEGGLEGGRVEGLEELERRGGYRYLQESQGGWNARAGGSRGSRMRRGCRLVPGPVRLAGLWGSSVSAIPPAWGCGVSRPRFATRQGKPWMDGALKCGISYAIARRLRELSLECLLCRSRVSVAS